MYVTVQRLKLFPSKYQGNKETYCSPWENDRCQSDMQIWTQCSPHALSLKPFVSSFCNFFRTLIDISLPSSRSADRIRWTDSIFLEYTMCCDEVWYLVSLNFIKSVIKLHFSLNSPKMQRRFFLLVILPYSQWRCEHCFLCACMVSPRRVIFVWGLLLGQVVSCKLLKLTFCLFFPL